MVHLEIKLEIVLLQKDTPQTNPKCFNLPRWSSATALNLRGPDRMCLIQPRSPKLCWAASAVCFIQHQTQDPELLRRHRKQITLLAEPFAYSTEQ